MVPRALASSPAPRHHRTLSSTLIDESVAAAAELVEKWHPDDTPTSTTCSLFLHSDVHSVFLRATASLHRAMLFFASSGNADSSGLVRAQGLLQTAMRRLDLELRLLLQHLHDDDDDRVQAATPISSVVRAMMAAGYGKECVTTFKSSRRAALTAKLQRLRGHHPALAANTNSNLNKLA
jgi:exocyst complex component 7